MTDAILDTTVLVDVLREHPPALTWKANQAEFVYGVTSITWMKLLKGAQDKAAQQKAMKLLSGLEIIILTAIDQRWAMANYAAFKLSHGVGMYDALIAAPAQRLGIPLYTHNLKHIQPLLPNLDQKPY